MITDSVHFFTALAILFSSYHTVPVERSATEGAVGHVSSGATSVTASGYTDYGSSSDTCKKCGGVLDS